MIVGHLPYLLSTLLFFSPLIRSAAVDQSADIAHTTNTTRSIDVVQSSSALLGNCNGAAALQCCLAVVESTDLVALAALVLAGVIPPLIPTQVGLFCIPQTAELGHLWYVCFFECVSMNADSNIASQTSSRAMITHTVGLHRFYMMPLLTSRSVSIQVGIGIDCNLKLKAA